jgi:hypothetical protein
VLDTPRGVSDTLKEVVELQAHARAIVHRQPIAKFSSQAK